MSDSPYLPPVPIVFETKPLTQAERVLYTFSAPSKTFADIKRSASWWLPFVLTLIFSFGLFFTIQAKVGWEQVAENSIRASPKRAAQMDKLTPEQRATNMKFTVIITEAIFAAVPVFALIAQMIIAGVLLATINFGFAGKANFWEVLSVCWYAGLPGLIKVVLGIVALLVGMAPESFNSQNFSGTNIGFYLPPETSKGLMALATSLDAVTIWTLVLTGIGLSIVAGTKRSAGFISVFGWWVLIVLIGIGSAVAFS
jgi:hypothetical protein